MKIHKLSRGVTIIELLLGMAILGMIGVGLVSLQYILSQNQIAITKGYKYIDDANYIVSTFTREIRGARQSDNGSYLLALANDTEIVFYSDTDLDGKVEWVRYYLNGTTFAKEIIKPLGYPAVYDQLSKKTSILSDAVRNTTTPLFYYYNEDWPTDTTNNHLLVNDRLSKTKTIKIYLRINGEVNPDKDYVIESSAQIRSSKENL